jgi:hypothetical protein
MALTNDDKDWIVGAVTSVVEHSEGKLRDEMGQMEARLRVEMGQMETKLCDKIDQTENRLRDEIRMVRSELEALKQEAYRLNDNRQTDEETIFSDISKVLARCKKLEVRVARLEKQTV